MWRVISCLILSLIIIAGCSKEENKEPRESESAKVKEETGSTAKTGIKDLDNFVDNMKDVQKAMEEGKKFEVVDFRELKALLPEVLGDLKRADARGEKTGAMGFTVSKAEADYNSEDYSKSINIEISDTSGATGFAGIASWGWAMTDIDREDDTGYEKTINYKGNKALERYNNQDRSGSIEIMIARRFMMSVNGNGVSMDEIKNAADKIDIGKLEAMKEANPVNK